MSKKGIHAWDIHIHSHHSPDSRSKIDAILKAAKRRGLDGIAITDHGTLAGYFEARPLARKYGLGLVAGYEYKSAEGDIVVLGVEKMPSRPRLSARDVVDFAHSLGGVAIAVHPFDLFRPGIGKFLGTIDVDAVETVNSHCFLYGNTKARRVAAANFLTEVGGSDAHISSEVGNGVTIFSGRTGIINAIKSGKTTAGGGKDFPTFFKMLGSLVPTIVKFLSSKLKKTMAENEDSFGISARQARKFRQTKRNSRR